MRMYLKIAVLLIIVASQAHAQGQSNYYREWLSKDGRRLVGSLDSIDLESDEPTIRLVNKDSETKEFKLDLLSHADQAYVRLQQINAEDREQFELVADHIEALRSTPRSVAGILQQIGKSYRLAPYAGVWCCIAYSAGDNKPDKGIAVCREAIKRIAEQRKFDASRHSRTLSAALNNLGVCYIKQRDGNAAANQFVAALAELDYVPPILAHNIRHLLEMKEKPSGLKLENKWVVAMQSSMADRRVLEPRKKMQQGWYYSLDLDVPPGLENELSVAGVLSPDPTLELIASGTGIVVAPGYVLTVRSSVTHPDRSAFLTTVGVPIESKARQVKEKDSGDVRQWKQIPARRLIVTQPEKQETGGTDSFANTTSNWTTATFSEADTVAATLSPDEAIYGTVDNTRSAGIKTGVMNSRTVANSTNYIIIHPKKGPEEELAVLQIDGLRIKPITFSNDEVPTGHACRVTSFERGPEMLKNGLRPATGKILGKGDLDAELRVDIPFNGGQRGAALYDRNFLALGLACTTKSGKDGIALSAHSIRAWFEQNVKAASLNFADDDALKRAERDVQDATIPIFVWGKRSDSLLQNPLYNQFFNDDNLIETHVLRDQYCIACRGKGNVPCTQCKGQGAVQNGIKQIRQGTNPRTGQALLANVPNMVPCPTCDGNTRHVCPICRGSGENPGGPNP